MPAAGELVAAGRTVLQVQRKIGADWLIYQDLDDLVAAVHHEKADIQGFDTSCFSGEYVTGDVSRAYLDALEVIRSNSAKARRDAKVRAEESEDDTIQVASGL
jgi:amidophosphoribosyltransferase